MKKLLLALATTLCLTGAAQAQVYLSLPASTLLVSTGVVPMSGLAVGTYHVYGDVGIRATAQTSLVSVDGRRLVEGMLDGMYSYGEEIVFYTGAGLGFSSLAGGGAFAVGGFVGADFDASSVISLFLEVRPTYYVGELGAVQVRSGLNFHLGGAGGGDGVQGACCVIP